jgi:hypothetical protein
MGYIEPTSMVVEDIYKATHINKPVYEIRGENLPYCSPHIDKHGNFIDRTYDVTLEGLNALFKPAYITESLYASITKYELRAIFDNVLGIIQDDFYHHYFWFVNYYGESIYCFAQKPDAAIRPVPPLAICEGVLCEDKCIGYDSWSTVCDDDVCIDDTLLETNSPDCGYVPHICDEGEKRSPETCWDGSTIHNDVCVSNTWVPSGETCSIDPCEGVVCDPTCNEYDLWSQICSDGVCIDDSIIETNSPDCGYIPPDDPGWYDTIADYWGYIFLLIAAGATIDHLSE